MSQANSFDPEELAAALGARLRELPREPGASAFVVELADGRAPILLRDHGSSLSISISNVKWWSVRRGQPSAELLDELVATTRAWAESHPLEMVTHYELMLHLAEALEQALGERWMVSIPGVADPQEAWLRGPNCDAGSVGVFPGRALVWIGDVCRESVIVTREQLARSSEVVIAAVHEQLAAYQANVELGEHIRARAEQLAAELGERFGGPCRVEVWGRPNPGRAIEARVLGNQSGELARVFGRAGEVVIHAGLVGEDGFESDEDHVDLEAIVAAIELARSTLTIEGLSRGRHYRVIRSIGELREGMVVRFVGFDDIDNHYGIYEFADPDGRKLGVPGDYSTPRNSPLGQVHRYLQPVESPPSGE